MKIKLVLITNLLLSFGIQGAQALQSDFGSTTVEFAKAGALARKFMKDGLGKTDETLNLSDIIGGKKYSADGLALTIEAEFYKYGSVERKPGEIFILNGDRTQLYNTLAQSFPSPRLATSYFGTLNVSESVNLVFLIASTLVEKKTVISPTLSLDAATDIACPLGALLAELMSSSEQETIINEFIKRL